MREGGRGGEGKEGGEGVTSHSGGGGADIIIRGPLSRRSQIIVWCSDYYECSKINIPGSVFV